MRQMTRRWKSIFRSGFSLIELMVVLLIIGLLMVFAIDEYLKHIERARETKARADLEALSKAVRMYTLKEERPFEVATFSKLYLGNFIGNYLEKDPPNDPWDRPYYNRPELGILYSWGSDGIDGYAPNRISTDDVIFHYLPTGFYLTRAEYIDNNRNNRIDFGDLLELSLSRPGKLISPIVFDFVSSYPAQAFGSAKVIAASQGQTLQIEFAAPVLPTFEVGKTLVSPREFIDSIVDFSRPPIRLASSPAVVIQRRKM